MKHLLSIFILLGITSVAYSNTKELPEGTKLYCKEVHFTNTALGGSKSDVIERIGSNIRKLFIINDDKIYEIQYLANFEYEIIGKTEYATHAKNSSEPWTITYLHETESIKQIHFFDTTAEYYQYNCSKNKNSIY